MPEMTVAFASPMARKILEECGFKNIHAGDTKQRWDADQPEEVAIAKDAFTRLTNQGFKAFRVDNDGDKDGKMDKFDPTAEAVILVPPVAGG